MTNFLGYRFRERYWQTLRLKCQYSNIGHGQITAKQSKLETQLSELGSVSSNNRALPQSRWEQRFVPAQYYLIYLFILSAKASLLSLLVLYSLSPPLLRRGRDWYKKRACSGSFQLILYLQTWLLFDALFLSSPTPTVPHPSCVLRRHVLSVFSQIKALLYPTFTRSRTQETLFAMTRSHAMTTGSWHVFQDMIGRVHSLNLKEVVKHIDLVSIVVKVFWTITMHYGILNNSTCLSLNALSPLF